MVVSILNELCSCQVFAPSVLSLHPVSCWPGPSARSHLFSKNCFARAISTKCGDSENLRSSKYFLAWSSVGQHK
eukprot:5448076-Amphidinium_carterae.1